jgi:hypothetical protein
MNFAFHEKRTHLNEMNKYWTISAPRISLLKLYISPYYVGLLSSHRASKSCVEEHWSRSHNSTSHCRNVVFADGRKLTRLGKCPMAWMSYHVPRRSVKLVKLLHSTLHCAVKTYKRRGTAHKTPCVLDHDSRWRRVLSWFHASATLLTWIDSPGPKSIWTRRWRSRRHFIYRRFLSLRWYKVES